MRGRWSGPAVRWSRWSVAPRPARRAPDARWVFFIVEADRAELAELGRRIGGAGDLASVVEPRSGAEDAEVMAPDSDVVQGEHAIEAFFKAASQAAQRLGMRRTIHVRQVECSGDLGYVLSTVVLELPAAAGQATTTFNDVTVWKLDAGRGWRIVAGRVR